MSAAGEADVALFTPLLTGTGPWALRNTRTGAVLATDVELAGDSASRRRGLLGRDRLEPGHALAIAPCGAIHTFFMRFAIDVLFVRKDGRVVKCADDVRPWRIAIALTAYAAIELPAGTLRESGTRRGDRVAFESDASRPSSG